MPAHKRTFITFNHIFSNRQLGYSHINFCLCGCWVGFVLACAHAARFFCNRIFLLHFKNEDKIASEHRNGYWVNEQTKKPKSYWTLEYIQSWSCLYNIDWKLDLWTLTFFKCACLKLWSLNFWSLCCCLLTQTINHINTLFRYRIIEFVYPAF